MANPPSSAAGISRSLVRDQETTSPHLADDSSNNNANKRLRSQSLADASNNSSKRAKEEPICSICYDRLITPNTPQKLSTLPCHDTHTFHTPCIRQWLGNQTICPLDRKPVDIHTLEKLQVAPYYTPLITAIRNGDAEEAQRLIEHNDNHLNEVDINGVTAVMWATEVENHGLATALISRLSIDELNEQDNHGNSALMYAAMSGNHAVITDLLNAGASPNIADNGGWTPLNIAVEQNNTTTMARLLRANASVNHTDEINDTPLITAAKNGCTAAAFMLLAYGADPYAKNISGHTALDAARHCEHWDTVDYLSKFIR